MMGEIVERVRKVEGPRFARSAISRIINPWKKTTRLTWIHVPGWPNHEDTSASLHQRGNPKVPAMDTKGVASIGLLVTSSTRRKCLLSSPKQAEAAVGGKP